MEDNTAQTIEDENLFHYYLRRVSMIDGSWNHPCQHIV